METAVAVASFAALAQETRLDAFRLLVKAGPAGLSAGAIADALRAAPSVMSFHLKELVHADLVGSRREGRSVIYAAHYEGVRELIDFLMAECCQGDPRLCGPYARPADAARRGIEKETA